MSNTSGSWVVKVRSVTDELITVVPFRSLMLSSELDGPGAASCTFDLDSDFLDYGDVFDRIFESDNLWEFYLDEVLVFDWLPTNCEISYVDESLDRQVTVSGKGVLDCLRHALVLPPIVNKDITALSGQSLINAAEITAATFTEGSGMLYKYGELPTSIMDPLEKTNMMRHWYQMYLRAKQRFLRDEATTSVTSLARSFLPTLSFSFNTVTDSNGVAWTPTQERDGTCQANGVNLLDLLSECAKIQNSSFYMAPGGVLSVAEDLGQDLSQSVVFYNPTLFQKSRTRDRGDVGNSVYGIDSNFVLYQPVGGSVLKGIHDVESRTSWGRRERLVSIPGDGTGPDVTQSPAALTSAELEKYKEELSSWTISAPPFIEIEQSGGDPITINRAFLDYQVGDWVGFASEGRPSDPVSVEKIRVVAISASVDEAGDYSTQLTLQTNIQLLRELADVTR